MSRYSSDSTVGTVETGVTAGTVETKVTVETGVTVLNRGPLSL